MKFRCQYKYCKGIIDLKKEIEWIAELEKVNPTSISWMIHTIVCPECGNSVGFLQIGPDPWVKIDDSEHGQINDPRNSKKKRKTIKFKGDNVPNKYLKDWAQIDRRSTKRRKKSRRK